MLIFYNMRGLPDVKCLLDYFIETIFYFFYLLQNNKSPN